MNWVPSKFSLLYLTVNLYSQLISERKTDDSIQTPGISPWPASIQHPPIHVLKLLDARELYIKVLLNYSFVLIKSTIITFCLEGIKGF